MQETWLPVVGYEGLYEVSDLGRVRSLPKVTSRGGRMAAPVVRMPGKVLKPVPTKKGGYLTIRLYPLNGGKGTSRSYRIHRLVLAAFVGPCPPGLEGCHYDGDPKNNALTNLRWDTYEANRADMRRHGRHLGRPRRAA